MPAPVFQPWLGAFETLRVERGQPRNIALHRASLRRTCAALGIGAWFDSRVIEQAQTQVPTEDGRWRWIVRDGHTQTLFTPEALPPSELNARSCRATISDIRVSRNAWDARFKTVSYLGHWQAVRTADSDEVVVLNERGEVASAGMANLFWAHDGQLHTPSTLCGCRAGTVRDLILRHHPVRCGAFRVEALRKAEEIFLTNSLWGIRPVTQLGGRRLAVGPITSAVAKLA